LLLLLPAIRRPPPRSPLFPYTTLFRSSADTTGQAATTSRSRLPWPIHCRRKRTISVNAGFDGCSGRPRGTRTPAINIFGSDTPRSEEHTSELQSLTNLVCRLLLEKKKE